MNIFTKWWENDGLDAISPKARFLITIITTGIAGFLLEYIGIEVLHAFTNASPYTIYIVIVIWAIGLGPVIYLFRKSSMIIPMAIVGILFFIIVLYNHFHTVIWQFTAGAFVDTGRLSAPRIWEFKEGAIFGLKDPLAIAFVAGLIETVVVPGAVILQKLVSLLFKKPQNENLGEIKKLFEPSVHPLNSFKIKIDFGYFLMRFIFFAYGAYFVFMVIGLLTGGKSLPIVGMMFINPPETVNTVMKLTLMISLSAIGAFNKDMRRTAAVFLAFGHIISVAASLWMYFSFPVNPLFPMDQQFLLMTVVADGLLVVCLIYIIVGPGYKESKLEKTEDIELRSPASTLLKNYFLIFSVLFSGFTVAIAAFRMIGSPESGLGAVFGGPDPLVSNSLTKYGTLAFMGWYMFFKPALRKYFIPVIVLGFSFSLVATFVYAFQGSTVLMSRLGTFVTLPWFMVQHIVVDGAGLVLLLAFRNLQYKVDYNITSVAPGSAECIMALNRSLRTGKQGAESVSREVLQKIDEQIGGIKGRKRGLIGFPFWVIEYVFPFVCSFRPPFSTMSLQQQRWMIRKYLLRPNYEYQKALSPGLAGFMHQIGFISNTLATLSFFTTEKGHSYLGYIPPDARKRLQKEVPSERPPVGSEPVEYPSSFEDPKGKRPVSEPGLVSKNLAPRIGSLGPANDIPDEVDYCIIGSGAAGGLIAYRLGAAIGKNNSICVIERGGYYLPTRDFSDDEMRMSRMLFAEGGLQLTKGFDLKVLQGECVGGTTVTNNAVCFKMPERARNEWENFGINVNEYDKHYSKVESEINIKQLTDISVNQEAESLFLNGVKEHNKSAAGMGVLYESGRNMGNFNNCIGCGLCNVACKYMRKMSVLETYIPWAQSYGVKVISNTGAVQCETDNSARKKVTAVIVRRSDGEFKRIGIRKALIVSGGAIASSRFLIRSKVGGKSAGKQISCNFAVPPLVVFGKNINAFDGLQMTMYAFPESHEAVFETTFNSPGTYAIAMQTFFDKHAGLMESFTKSVNFTALVGSDPGGSVSLKRDVLFGRAIEWNQTEDDITRIKKAMVTILNMAKGAGAEKVYLPTFPTLEVDLRQNLDGFIREFNEKLNHKKYFDFYTAHPQGGNLMASDSFNERVVDTDFRVKDTENLYVCDASIFPRGVKVNPQWTIMAAASLASEKIISKT